MENYQWWFLWINWWSSEYWSLGPRYIEKCKHFSCRFNRNNSLYTSRLWSQPLACDSTCCLVSSSLLQHWSFFFPFCNSLLQTLHLSSLYLVNLLFLNMNATMCGTQTILGNVLLFLNLVKREEGELRWDNTQDYINTKWGDSLTLSSLGCLQAVLKRSSDASLVLLNFISADGPISSISMRGVFWPDFFSSILYNNKGKGT